MKAQWFRFAGVAVALTVGMALSGCTSADNGEPEVAPRIVTSDRPEPSGMEALIQITMEVGDDGCVTAQAGGELVTLVWPKGYTARGDSTSFDVLDADGKVVARAGTALAVGGGGVDSVDDAWGELDCAMGRLWMVGSVNTA